jgi:drug/metabolite transporter (DMT)-like permease
MAYLAGVAATCGWASLYAVAKPALEEVTPVELALCRAGIAAVARGVLAGVVARRGLAEIVRMGPKGWGRVALIGTVSFAGTSLMAMTAQRFLPASINGVLNNLAPLWVAAYAAVSGRARSGPLLVGGTLLASMGVALVLLGGQAPTDAAGRAAPAEELALGAAISLAGSVLIAFSNVATRRLMRGRDPLALTAVGAACGTAPLLALAVFGAGGSLGGIAAASAATKLRLLWLGTACTAFNFALWSFALAHLPVTRVIPLQYLVAPGGVVLAVALLGEPLGIQLAAGTAAILVGIVLAQRGAERA